MATTPKDLMYSAALKPVSIPSTAQTRKFLPITSGDYTATGNNIIRIPVNANGFVDMKNAMLKYRITTAGAAGYFNGAHSPFQRFQVLSPDGAPLETIDNYNRIYSALSALEMSRDNFTGFQNMISGTSNQILSQYIVGGATAIDGYVGGVQVGSFDFAATGADNMRVGNYRFSTDGTTVTVSYLNESFTVTRAIAAAAYRVINGLSFTFGSSGAAINAVSINGVACAANVPITLPEQGDAVSAQTTSEVLASGAVRTYSHNPLSCLTKLDVLYPAFAVGGGGVVLELTLDTNACVLTAGDSASTPTYTISSVELIVPVIQYPESVVSSFKQMLNSVGSVSMSSVSLQNYVYPYSFGAPATNSSLSIPIAVRNRSLKALYFFFQETQSTTNACRLARDSPTAMNFYLRIGSQYFPAQQVQYTAQTSTFTNATTVAQTSGNITEVAIELGKSVSKLNDIRHGSVLNVKSFSASALNGGQSIFGIDLEASAVSFLENGLNTADNGLSTYLEISNLAGPTAGNVQIFALFDNTISVMANGNLLLTK